MVQIPLKIRLLHVLWMATIIESNITEYPLNIALLGTIGLMIETKGFPYLIHQFGGFRRECIVHNVSFWCNFIFLKKARFTPLVSNMSVLGRKYLRKISSPSRDYFLTA